MALQAQLGRVARYANPAQYASANAATVNPDASLQASDPARAAAIAEAQRQLQSGAGNTNNPAMLPYLAGPNAPNVQGRPTFPYGGIVTGQGFPARNTNAGIANASQIPTSGVPPMPPPTPGAPPAPAASNPTYDPRADPLFGGPGYPTPNAPPYGVGTPGMAGFPATATGGGGFPASAFPPTNPVRTSTGGAAPIARKRTTIPATATANVPPAGRSPFVTLDRPQNADVVGGARGGALARGGPQGTALDLSRLFSRQ
jgi:hypothetical protein